MAEKEDPSSASRPPVDYFAPAPEPLEQAKPPEQAEWFADQPGCMMPLWYRMDAVWGCFVLAIVSVCGAAQILFWIIGKIRSHL